MAFTSDPMKDTEGYLTEEQFKHLIRYANRDRDRVLFTFLFYTGRRISEVIRCLIPDDFNFMDNMVYFTILKRKRPMKKWINVNSRIMKMMKDYIELCNINNNEFIFKINRHRADQIIKELGERAGMLYVGKKKIHCQMFRHSFAIMMAKRMKNSSIMEGKKLQNLLAHADWNSTSYYLEHFNPEEMKKFVESI